MDSAKPVRLQAYLAKAGIASRRACERIILQGRVSLNGRVVVELGTKVGTGDEVRCDGRVVTQAERLIYVALNKPPGYLCASSDAYGRKLAIDLLKKDIPERLYNVGRLDYRSSGLIFFTNDGNFARSVSHPSSRIEKEYFVETDKELPDSLLDEFKRGIMIDGEPYKMHDFTKTSSHTAHVVLVEGKNREIRKVLESRGIRPLRLHRIRIGNYSIQGIASGNYESMDDEAVGSILTLAEGKRA
jgi:23S rRNA pseudouridine2605 synthase